MTTIAWTPLSSLLASSCLTTTKHTLPDTPTGTATAGAITGLFLSFSSFYAQKPLFPLTSKDLAFLQDTRHAPARLFLTGILGHAAYAVVYQGLMRMTTSTTPTSLKDPLQKSTDHSLHITLSTPLEESLETSLETSLENRRYPISFAAGALAGLVFQAIARSSLPSPVSPPPATAALLLSKTIALSGSYGLLIHFFNEQWQS